MKKTSKKRNIFAEYRTKLFITIHHTPNKPILWYCNNVPWMKNIGPTGMERIAMQLEQAGLIDGKTRAGTFYYSLTDKGSELFKSLEE